MYAQSVRSSQSGEKQSKRTPPPKGSNLKSKRPPAVEIDRRVMIVYKLICSGVRRGDEIFEYVKQMDSLPAQEQKMKNWIPWRVSRAMIFYYLQRAVALLREVPKKDAEEQRGELIEQAYEIYKLAKAAGKHSPAIMALREIARLRGLSQVGVFFGSGHTLEQIEKMIEGKK